MKWEKNILPSALDRKHLGPDIFKGCNVAYLARGDCYCCHACS